MSFCIHEYLDAGLGGLGRTPVSKKLIWLFLAEATKDFSEHNVALHQEVSGMEMGKGFVCTTRRSCTSIGGVIVAVCIAIETRVQ